MESRARVLSESFHQADNDRRCAVEGRARACSGSPPLWDKLGGWRGWLTREGCVGRPSTRQSHGNVHRSIGHLLDVLRHDPPLFPSPCPKLNPTSQRMDPVVADAVADRLETTSLSSQEDGHDVHFFFLVVDRCVETTKTTTSSLREFYYSICIHSLFWWYRKHG